MTGLRSFSDCRSHNPGVTDGHSSGCRTSLVRWLFNWRHWPGRQVPGSRSGGRRVGPRGWTRRRKKDVEPQTIEDLPLPKTKTKIYSPPCIRPLSVGFTFSIFRCIFPHPTHRLLYNPSSEKDPFRFNDYKIRDTRESWRVTVTSGLRRHVSQVYLAESTQG